MKKKHPEKNRHSDSARRVCRRGTALLLALVLAVSGVFCLPFYATSLGFDANTAGTESIPDASGHGTVSSIAAADTAQTDVQTSRAAGDTPVSNTPEPDTSADVSADMDALPPDPDTSADVAASTDVLSPEPDVSGRGTASSEAAADTAQTNAQTSETVGNVPVSSTPEPDTSADVSADTDALPPDPDTSADVAASTDVLSPEPDVSGRGTASSETAADTAQTNAQTNKTVGDVPVSSTPEPGTFADVAAGTDTPSPEPDSSGRGTASSEAAADTAQTNAQTNKTVGDVPVSSTPEPGTSADVAAGTDALPPDPDTSADAAGTDTPSPEPDSSGRGTASSEATADTAQTNAQASETIGDAPAPSTPESDISADVSVGTDTLSPEPDTSAAVAAGTDTPSPEPDSSGRGTASSEATADTAQTNAQASETIGDAPAPSTPESDISADVSVGTDTLSPEPDTSAAVAAGADALSPEPDTSADVAANIDALSPEAISATAAENEMSFEALALDALRTASLAEVFGNSTVLPENFIAEKNGESFALPSGWSGLASGSLYGSDGALRSTLFPEVAGYHIVSATVHDTAIRHIGTLTTRINGQEMTFVYYSTDPELNEQSVTVLEDGGKITLHYEENEFDITYTMTGDTAGLSLDGLFGKNRPQKTRRHAYSMNVTVPRGYTGIVYINGQYQIPTDGYGYLSLGSDPTYEATSAGAAISAKSLPRFFSRSGTYAYDNVKSAQHVSILMMRRGDFLGDGYQFDPHFWLSVKDVSERIKTNMKNAEKITKLNPDGTYSYTWYFNTYVIPNVWQTYMLRTLEINGEPVAVPFFESRPSSPNVSATTTLSTGTRIRITLTYIEKDTLTPQSGLRVNNYMRHYRLDVENAAENLTITGGTVTEARSSQNVLSEASGVEVQYAIAQSGGRQWTSKEPGDITPASSQPLNGYLGYGYYSTGTDGKFQGNVRFRLLSGFHVTNDIYTFRNSAGSSIGSGAFNGPDKDGWYYIKLSAYSPDSIRPTTLEIKAAPNRYAVRYLPGSPVSGAVENMPEFDASGLALPAHTDANKGNYYLPSGSGRSGTEIPIAPAPENRAGIPATFLSWTVDGGSAALEAESTATLDELMEYAVYDGALDVWLITLTAQWQNNRFQYSIDLQWDTPDGEIHTQENAATISTASGAQRDGQKLRFLLSKDADVITGFLESHPGYRLSADNTYLFEVNDNGHITIRFEQVPAVLNISKQLLDENQAEVSSVREFLVNLTLSDPQSGQPLNADYDGLYPYTVTNAAGETSDRMLSLADGRGAFYLRPGETAGFAQLPADTEYDVKEESLTDFTAEYTGKSGTLQSSAASHAAIVNRRNVLLTVRKLTAGGSADPDRKWNFTVTMSFGEDQEEIPFTLSHNESYVIQGWPVGTKYTITETDANQDGYETIITGSETAKDGVATGLLRNTEAANGITVTYTNTNAAGNLVLSKAVAGNGGYAAREFTFNVTLTAPSDEPLKDSYTYIAPDGESRTLNLTGDDNEKTGTLTLRHNQTVILENLSGGTGYTITEEEIPSLVPPYQVSHIVNNGTRRAGSTVSGTIPQASGGARIENTSVVFANIREVQNVLTISKMVENGESVPTDAQKTQAFSFSLALTGTDLAESYPYTDALGNRGTLHLSGNAAARTGSFQLTHSSAISIEGLPAGTKYQITEAPVSGYTPVTPSNSSGTLGEQPVRVDFVNRADPCTLTISKQVTGTPLLPDAAFFFDVSLKNPDGTPLKGSYSCAEASGGMIQGGSGTISLKDGESAVITGLPTGTGYLVKERPADGYLSDQPDDGYRGTLTDVGVSSSVTAVNAAKTCTLSVTKKVEDDALPAETAFDIQIRLTTPDGDALPGSYVYTTTSGRQESILNGSGILSLQKNETASIAGLPYGALYQVTETAYPGCTVHYQPGNSGTLTKDTAVTVVNSSLSAHSLTIAKQVEGSGGNPADLFDFFVTLTIPDGTAANPTQLSYTGPGTGDRGVLEYRDDTWQATPAIRLRSGEQVTISGLPEGTLYSVSEAERGERGYVTTAPNDTGRIGTEDVTALFTNTRQNKLTAAVLVTGNGAPADKVFSLHITLTPPAGTTLADSCRYSGTDAFGQTDGVIAFSANADGTYSGEVSLKDQQYVTLLGLPSGTAFRITESDNAGFATMSSGSSGTLLATDEGYSKTALFTNEWFSPVSLTLRKIAAEDLAASTGSWEFAIRLHSPDGAVLADSYPYLDADGSAHTLSLTGTAHDRSGTVTLSGGESALITGLPVGTTYAITELRANMDGYITSVTGADTVQDGVASGTLRSEQTTLGAVVTFINASHAGDLILTKTVTGTGGNRYRLFDFRITLEFPSGTEPTASLACLDSAGTTRELALSGSGSIRNGSVSLAHGDTVTLLNLPSDTVYTIEEEPVTGISPGYAVSCSINGAAAVPGARISGRIPSGEGADAANTTVLFSNSRKDANSLTIEKQTAGPGRETDRGFAFTITLTDSSGDELTDNFIYLGSLYGVLHSGDTITLRHGQHITIENLPEGAHYTVKEADDPAYVSSAENASGTIRADTSVSFTNTRIAAALTLAKRQLVNGREAGENAAVNAGDTITYELTLANTGSVPATGITLNDAIPAGLILTEGSISDAGTAASGTVVWSLPALGAQQEKTVSFSVTVPPEATGAVWTNQALARYDNAPENPDVPGAAQDVRSNPVTLHFEKNGDQTPETDPSPETQPESEPETASETESETEPASETESESETASETESEPETAPETESESETASETESESETASETESEIESESESASEPETETASETEPSSETERKTEAQSDTKSPGAPKTGDGTPILPYLSTALLALVFLERMFRRIAVRKDQNGKDSF